jgi:hypothetical protein
LYQALLGDAKFHQLLLAFDRDLAAAARATPCARCRGVLHSGGYQRKPRGRPDGLGEAYDRRFSFSCSRRDCRKRKTPASLRFLGPKVYVASMVVVISAMRDGATAALQKLSQLVGVSRRTIARWRKWWLSIFAASPFWRLAAAAFMPPIDKERLPASLLERFAGSVGEQLIALLRFLGPITGVVAMRAA